MDDFESIYAASTLDMDICDHEKMNAEFERFARFFWDESARRADRRAREECAEIARAHASCEGIAESIEYEIRNTIPE